MLRIIFLQKKSFLILESDGEMISSLPSFLSVCISLLHLCSLWTQPQISIPLRMPRLSRHPAPHILDSSSGARSKNKQLAQRSSLPLIALFTRRRRWQWRARLQRPIYDDCAPVVCTRLHVRVGIHCMHLH